MRRWPALFASAAVIALSACGQAEAPTPPGPGPDIAAAPPAPAPDSAATALTADGLGPIRIGMSEAQVRQAVGPDRIDGDTGADFGSCKEMKLKGDLEGTWVMFEDDKATRVSIGDPSTVKTDKGLGLGATAAQVRAAYGSAIQAEPHKYEGPGAEYLTVWTVPDVSGIKYETGPDGLVQGVYGGGPSILYVEGCA